MLESDGFIVVCGPPGTGKTTLCLYLAFRFLREQQERQAYYLRTKAAMSLNDELAFLEQEIQSDTLFIIDDQNLACDEVENLVRTFMDFLREGKARAKLAVATTITYTRAQALVRGHRESELNQATAIRLPRTNEGDTILIIETLRTQAALESPLSNEELSTLSQGNIGIALFLARCSQDFGDHFSLRQLFEKRVLGNTLTDWILSQIGHKGDMEFYQNEVSSVFIVGSYSLPIPGDLTIAVDMLHASGFLVNMGFGDSSNSTFQVENINLARIISEHYTSHRFSVLSSYLSRYPEYLPAICERLSDNDHSRSMLKKLCEVHFDDISKALLNRLDPISLGGVTMILRAIRLAAESESRKLLREIIAPHGQFNLRFLSDFICGRATNAMELKKFFEVIYAIDRYSIRQLVDTQLKDIPSEVIISLFELESCRLDQITACLHAIDRCSKKLSGHLYSALKKSQVLAKKIAQTDKDPRGMSIWLRFCEHLRPLNYRECYSYLEHHLPAHNVVNSILAASEFTFMSRFLLRVRRLHPKLAATVVSVLWTEHQDLLENLLRGQEDLTAITNDLHAISKLNRRIAVAAASSVKKHICELVHSSEHYYKVGGAIESLRINVGAALAYDSALSIDRERLLPQIQGENRRFELMGKYLYYLSLIPQGIAGWFRERLDYREYLRHIDALVFRDLVYLVRGFLAASNVGDREKLLVQFSTDHILINEFCRGWKNASNLTETAFCLSLLLDIPLEQSYILKLLDINFAALEIDMQSRFSDEQSILHISNGLYGLAKFDLEIASIVLRQYVERIEAEAKMNDAVAKERGRFSRHRQIHHAPRGYEPSNIVNVACLFQIVSAIEPSEASRLASLIDIKRFEKYALDEANLGRLALFILGLRDASYKLSREFVQQICSKEIWQKQFQENEELENVIHFARALSKVSRIKGREYVEFIVDQNENYIHDILEIEANLMLVANWLRILPMVGRDFAHLHVERMSRYLLSTIDYDTRLRHLLEATEALIECGQPEVARKFSDQVLLQISQLRSIRKLDDWIILFHKAMRIGRELNIPNFLKRLFADSDTFQILAMLTFENQVVLKAYTYHLFSSIKVDGLERLSHAIIAHQSQILNAAGKERSVAMRAVALILANASLVEIQSTAQSLVWKQAWERGLAALLFAAAFPNEANPFAIHPEMSMVEWQESLCKDMNEHIGNLEFALVLHLAAMSGLSGDKLGQYQSIASERADDEQSAATRWLLKQQPGVIDLSNLHYYVWHYIKETVLRPTYLSWESDIVATADSIAFKHDYVRKAESILSFS